MEANLSPPLERLQGCHLQTEGWPKTVFGLFRTILRKNPDEHFGRPNTSLLPQGSRLVGQFGSTDPHLPGTLKWVRLTQESRQKPSLWPKGTSEPFVETTLRNAM